MFKSKAIKSALPNIEKLNIIKNNWLQQGINVIAAKGLKIKVSRSNKFCGLAESRDFTTATTHTLDRCKQLKQKFEKKNINIIHC